MGDEHPTDPKPDEQRRADEQLANEGDVHAMYRLAVSLAESEPQAARRWFEKAAELGYGRAWYALGYQAKDSDPREARRFWEHGAEVGNRSSMASLATVLDPWRIGTVLTDAQRRMAWHWWERAAELGERRAQRMMGWRIIEWDPLCRRMSAAKKDEARDWLERAADQGDRDAMRILGGLLPNAYGQPEQGRIWLEKATEAGHPSSRYLLNLLNSREANGPEAAHYAEAAAAHGTTRLQRIAPKLITMVLSIDRYVSTLRRRKATAEGEATKASVPQPIPAPRLLSGFLVSAEGIRVFIGCLRTWYADRKG